MPSRSEGERDGSTIRGLLAERLRLPERPADGDCLVWTPKVVDVLRSIGYRVAEVSVVGWVDVFSFRTIAFVHRAVLTRGAMIVDVTARQFAESLDPIWVGN